MPTIPTSYAPMVDEYLARTGQSVGVGTDASGQSDDSEKGIHNAYTLSFTLPLCPTANNLFLNTRRGRVKSKAYREWSERAAWFLKDVPAWLYGYPVAIDITIVSGKGWTLACDVANREKAAVDAIVAAGILAGDSCRYVRRVSIGCEAGADRALPAVMRVGIKTE